MERLYKLLILEDNEDDANLIIRLLDRANHTVISKTVAGKQSFIRALDSFVPDIIVSDHQLPDFSSSEALLITRTKFPFMPFILVTGTVSEEFAASIIKAGADDYLLKNNMNRLATAIEQAIERKKTESQLKIAHERLLFHVDNTPMGYIEWDNKFNIRSWSDRAQEIFGWSENEIVAAGSQALIRLVHPEDLQAIAGIANELRTGSRPRIEMTNRNITMSGSTIWCEWYNSVLKDEKGEVKSILSLVQNITHRKKTEENLELLVQRFREAQKIAHLGHWEIDLINSDVTWSEETFRILGMEPNSVAPAMDLFDSFIHPEDVVQYKATLAASQAAWEPFSFTLRIVRRDDTIRTIFTSATYQTKLQRVIGVYGIVLDVTELTEKEKELKRVNRELETFIYKTYHDLRSPIVSILGVVNLARKEVKDEKALHYFSIVDEVTMKQNKMLINLVKVMSIRDRQLIVEPVEVRSLLDETLLGLENMTDFKNVKVTLHEKSNTRVLTDRELLFDMLFQLIENSILYRNPNQAESEVNIYVSHDDPDNLVLEIVDNGIGMPASIADRVFDMFYRGTNLSKGFGLGLYLVKNAVEKLNGVISLTSVQDKGSTFSITFPARQISENREFDPQLIQ